MTVKSIGGEHGWPDGHLWCGTPAILYLGDEPDDGSRHFYFRRWQRWAIGNSWNGTGRLNRLSSFDRSRSSIHSLLRPQRPMQPRILVCVNMIGPMDAYAVARLQLFCTYI